MSNTIKLLGGKKMKIEGDKLYIYFPPEEPKAWYDKYGVLHAVPPKYDEDEA